MTSCRSLAGRVRRCDLRSLCALEYAADHCWWHQDSCTPLPLAAESIGTKRHLGYIYKVDVTEAPSALEKKQNSLRHRKFSSAAPMEQREQLSNHSRVVALALKDLVDDCRSRMNPHAIALSTPRIASVMRLGSASARARAPSRSLSARSQASAESLYQLVCTCFTLHNY